MRDHFSVSEINCFCKCPMAHAWHYKEGLPIRPCGKMILGSCVDASVSKSFCNKITKGELLPLEEVRAAYHQAWTEKTKEDIDWGQDSPDQLRDEGEGLVILHQKEVAPKVNPVAVQKEIRVSFQGLPDYLGFIDLVEKVDGKLAVTDLKTTGRSPGKDGQGRYCPSPDHALQVAAYAFCLKASGESPALANLDYLVRNKTPKAIRVSLPVTDRLLTYFENTALAVLTAIKKEAYYPNRGSFTCNPSFCSFWNVCNEKFPKSYF